MSASSYLQDQGFQDTYSYGQGIDTQFTDPNASYGQNTMEGAWDRLLDRRGFDLWKSNMDKLYEREATNSARAWDHWMDSTATQRRVKDIEAAGLNPWLALQSGGINANTSTSSAGSGSSARSVSEKSGSSLKEILGTILIVAKLISMF